MSKPKPNTKETTKELLNERNSTHGGFDGNALCAQALKNLMRGEINLEDDKERREFEQSLSFFTDGWRRLQPIHREALDMDMHKNARIINGDHTYDDHWDDKGGYAGLPKKFNHGRE